MVLPACAIRQRSLSSWFTSVQSFCVRLSRYKSILDPMSDAQNKTLKSHLWLLAVLVPALIIRLVYLAQYQASPVWEQLTVDNWYHHHWAQSLADGNLLGDTTYFRAPLYIYCLGALYALFGSSLWVGRLLGLVVGLASVSMTYLLGKKWLGKPGALIAAALHAALPVAIYFESELLLDPLFTLLLQLAVWRFLLWLERERPRDLFWAGLAFGLASICRPTALVVVALAAGWILFRPPSDRRHRGIGQAVRRVILFGLGVAVCIGPIFTRNLLVAGDPVLIASQGGINLYIGNNSAADGLSAVLPEPLGHNWQIRQINYMAESALGRPLKPGEVSDYWQNQATSWMMAHPGDFLSLTARKLVYLVGNREMPNERSLDLHFASFGLLGRNPFVFGLIFPVAVLGILVLGKREPQVRFITAAMLVLMIAMALFFVNSRFRLPLMPFFCLLAAGGIIWLWTTARRRAWLASALFIPIVALGWFSFHPPVSYPQSWSVQSLESQGLFLYSKGQWREAAAVFRRAADLQPEFPEANLNLGAAYLRLRIADSAQACFEKEIGLHPLRYKAYQNLASINLLDGHFQRASRLATEAIRLAPYDVLSNLVLLRTLASDTSIDNIQLARAVEEAAAATNDDLQVLNEGGSLLLTRDQASVVAVAILQRAETVRPPAIETDDAAFGPEFTHGRADFERLRGTSFHLLGYAYVSQKRLVEGVDYCRRAIAADSTLASAYFNLSSAYWLEGKSNIAESVLTEATRRFPDDPRGRD
jgi:4-amino-4-deoxy-L-arabinose transferase-like glycosyltransferase